MPGAVYWIARQTKWSERAAMVLLGSFALFGIYLAITSFAEYFQTWWLVFPPYITASALKGTSEFVGRGARTALAPDRQRHPAGHVLRQPAAVVAAAGDGVSGSGKGDRHLWPARPFGERKRGQAPFAGTALRVLRTKGACPLFRRPVPFSAGQPPFPPLAADRRGRCGARGHRRYADPQRLDGRRLAVALAVGLALPWRWRLPLLAGGLAAAGLLAAVQWDNLVEFKRDKALEADKTAESVELRPVMATVAWQMFRDRPLFGCGYNQYGTEHLNYVSDRSTDLPLERARGYIPHNVALSVLTETGLVGLGLFAATLGLWGRDAWRLWHNVNRPLWARQLGLLFLTALGAYVINGMFHDVSVVPMANMTLFFLAGVTAAAKQGIGDQDSIRDP